jgi:hypothetical protein
VGKRGNRKGEKRGDIVQKHNVLDDWRRRMERLGEEEAGEKGRGRSINTTE